MSKQMQMKISTQTKICQVKQKRLNQLNFACEIRRTNCVVKMRAFGESGSCDSTNWNKLRAVKNNTPNIRIFYERTHN